MGGNITFASNSPFQKSIVPFISKISKCFWNSLILTKGAFTPDATDANRANDLHVKSMQRRDRQSCGAIRANEAPRITALTNQELALVVTSLQAEAENPKQQWRTK